MTLGAVALDRATKLWVDANIQDFATIEIIPGFLNLVHSENRGMAFGIGNDGATWYTRLILIGLSVAVLGALGYGVWNGKRAATATKATEAWALFLVAGGAIGNLYDRVVRGSIEQNLARMALGLRGFIPDGLLFRVSEITPDAEAAYGLQDRFVREYLAQLTPAERESVIGALYAP